MSQTWWKDYMLSNHSLVGWGCPALGLIFPSMQWSLYQGKVSSMDNRP